MAEIQILTSRIVAIERSVGSDIVALYLHGIPANAIGLDDIIIAIRSDSFRGIRLPPDQEAALKEYSQRMGISVESILTDLASAEAQRILCLESLKGGL